MFGEYLLIITIVCYYMIEVGFDDGKPELIERQGTKLKFSD